MVPYREETHKRHSKTPQETCTLELWFVHEGKTKLQLEQVEGKTDRLTGQAYGLQSFDGEGHLKFVF